MRPGSAQRLAVPYETIAYQLHGLVDQEFKSPSAMGTAVTGKACNGWAFWHVERGGRLKLIDEFRQQLRAEMG